MNNIKQHTITAERGKTLVAKKKALLVDLRNPVAFRDRSIPNSINMSLRQLSTLQKHDKKTPVVLVSDNDSSTISAAINYLLLYGFVSVHVVPDIADWK